MLRKNNLFQVIESHNKQYDVTFDTLAQTIFSRFDKDKNNFLENDEISTFIEKFTEIYANTLLEWAKNDAYEHLFKQVTQKKEEELRNSLFLTAKQRITQFFKDINSDGKLDLEEVKEGLRQSVEAYWDDMLKDEFEEWLTVEIKK